MFSSTTAIIYYKLLVVIYHDDSLCVTCINPVEIIHYIICSWPIQIFCPAQLCVTEQLCAPPNGRLLLLLACLLASPPPFICPLYLVTTAKYKQYHIIPVVLVVVVFELCAKMTMVVGNFSSLVLGFSVGLRGCDGACSCCRRLEGDGFGWWLCGARYQLVWTNLQVSLADYCIRFLWSTLLLMW